MPWNRATLLRKADHSESRRDQQKTNWKGSLDLESVDSSTIPELLHDLECAAAHAQQEELLAVVETSTQRLKRHHYQKDTLVGSMGRPHRKVRSHSKNL